MVQRRSCFGTYVCSRMDSMKQGFLSPTSMYGFVWYRSCSKDNFSWVTYTVAAPGNKRDNPYNTRDCCAASGVTGSWWLVLRSCRNKGAWPRREKGKGTLHLCLIGCWDQGWWRHAGTVRLFHPWISWHKHYLPEIASSLKQNIYLQ